MASRHCWITSGALVTYVALVKAAPAHKGAKRGFAVMGLHLPTTRSVLRRFPHVIGLYIHVCDQSMLLVGSQKPTLFLLLT